MSIASSMVLVLFAAAFVLVVRRIMRKGTCACGRCGGCHKCDCHSHEAVALVAVLAAASAFADDSSVVSAEVSVAYESHHVSYGLIDTKAPIVTPSANVTLFDALTLESAFMMDTTHYSRKLGIGDRRWQYWEMDVGASLSHSLSSDDFEWLPCSIDFGVGYIYEYHPRYAKCTPDGVNGNPDTQFITAFASLPDYWLVPTFSYERDFIRDNGTYLNLEFAHDFELVPGEVSSDDPVLALALAAAQGFGNAPRVKSYLAYGDGFEEPLSHAGLMDTQLTATLSWNVNDWLTVSGYVAYVDFLFDSKIREASRWYEPGASGGHKADTSYHILYSYYYTYNN